MASPVCKRARSGFRCPNNASGLVARGMFPNTWIKRGPSLVISATIATDMRKLGQRLASQRLQCRGGIQLAADRFGNGQPRPDTLGALVEVLDRDGLIQVLAQQDGQIILGQADQALLSLQAGR